MNKYDQNFFQGYIWDNSKMLGVIHAHFIIVLDNIILNFVFLVLLPSFFYFKSDLLLDLIPFIYFEVYIACTFIKIVYDIFDWYNDVWIITDTSVIDVEWSFLNSNSVSLKFDNIEWIEVEESWIWDKILWKWKLVIHKVWEGTFELPEAFLPNKAVKDIEKAASGDDDLDIDFDDEDEDLEYKDKLIDVLTRVVKEEMAKKEEFWDDYNPEYEELEKLKNEVRQRDWTIDLTK